MTAADDRPFDVVEALARVQGRLISAARLAELEAAEVEVKRLTTERDAAHAGIAYLERQSAARLELWQAEISSHRGFFKEHVALQRWGTAVEADRDAITEAGNALAHALDLLASRAKFAVDALAAWRNLVPDQPRGDVER